MSADKSKPSRASQASQFQSHYRAPPFSQHPEYIAIQQKLSFLSQLMNRLEGTLAAAVPSLLYHYTTPKGLEAILNTRLLRLSNYRHFKDYDCGEIAYGKSLWNDHLRAQGARADISNLSRELLSACLQLADGPFNTWNDVFISCFTTDERSANHYHGFGNYSVGFRPLPLPNRVGRDHNGQLLLMPTNYILRKVEYEEDQQVKHLFEITDPFITFTDSFSEIIRIPEHRSELVGWCLEPIYRKLITVIPFFVNPSYADEKEWRLTCVKSGQTPNILKTPAYEFVEIGNRGACGFAIVDAGMASTISTQARNDMTAFIVSKGYVIRS